MPIDTVVVCVAFAGFLAMAAQAGEAPHEKLAARCRELMKDRDAFAAVQFLDEQADPIAAANAYAALLNDLYWKEHDLPRAVLIGQAGVQACLGRSQRSADAQVGETLKGAAKALAYNLGSFTWNGWDEKGIAPGPTDLAIGREAAKLNLRLAIELKRPAKAMADAHWLVGAHQLSAGEHAAAKESFTQARQLADGRPAQLMAEGYAAIAMIMAKDPQGQAKFDEAAAALMKDGSEDAKFFAEQLRTALGVFARGANGG